MRTRILCVTGGLLAGLVLGACDGNPYGACDLPGKPYASFDGPLFLIQAPDSTFFSFYGPRIYIKDEFSRQFHYAIDSTANLQHGLQFEMEESDRQRVERTVVVIAVPTPIVEGSYQVDEIIQLSGDTVGNGAGFWTLVDNPLPGHARMGYRHFRTGHNPMTATSVAGLLQITPMRSL